MQAVAMKGVSRRPTLVSVQAGSRQRWEVVVEQRERPQFFNDRDLALSYAQIWASVHRPSTVRVYGSAGAVEREWQFA